MSSCYLFAGSVTNRSFIGDAADPAERRHDAADARDASGRQSHGTAAVAVIPLSIRSFGKLVHNACTVSKFESIQSAGNESRTQINNDYSKSL